MEGDGGVSIEAAHVSRNTSVSGLTWIELPGIGRTVSGITPWPRGGDELNFTAGAGASVYVHFFLLRVLQVIDVINREYDFLTFNTIGGSGNVDIVSYLSPTWNANGQDRPLAFAVQVDSQTPQTNHFFPLSAPGTSPAAWGGYDGFVANSIITVNNTFPVPPGAHTLKVCVVFPLFAVALQANLSIVDMDGGTDSYRTKDRDW